MVRLKHKLSAPPAVPERGVKAATFRLLLDTAMEIIRENGRIPSVAEAAVRSACVSGAPWGLYGGCGMQDALVGRRERHV